MDKYDVLLISKMLRDKIKNIDFNVKSLQIKYLKWKYEQLLMESHMVRSRKYAKHALNSPGSIHRAFTLKLGDKYIWDLLRPMSKEEN